MDDFDAWWRDRHGPPITWMDDDTRGNAAVAWGHQQRIIDDLRTALAAATERAEAAERASDRLRAFCDAIDNMIPDGISHEGADTDDRVRDLVWRYVNTIARADALAARLREVDDREHPA